MTFIDWTNEDGSRRYDFSAEEEHSTPHDECECGADLFYEPGSRNPLPCYACGETKRAN